MRHILAAGDSFPAAGKQGNSADACPRLLNPGFPARPLDERKTSLRQLVP